MIRILQIVDNMDLGGIQAFIMNTYRVLVKQGVQFDFLVFHERKQLYENEILTLGGKVYKLPSRRDGFFKCRKALKKFFDEHKGYKVVHYQTSSLSFLMPLEIAAMYNIPIRIIHSHSTSFQGSKIHYYLHKINKKRIKKIATKYYSCGKLASQWMFSNSGCEKQVELIYNGIDISKYSFNQNNRERIRQELSLKEAYVIGNVGRLSEVKNQKFIIDILTKLKQKTEKHVVLMLVGDGELRSELEEYAIKKNVSDDVLFLGTRSDVADLLQAMDVMIMPSLYEGFPVAMVEAQASGLPCIVSSNITTEAIIKSNVKMLDLNSPISVWISEIDMNYNRIENNDSLIEAGFDISHVTKKLLSVYTQYENR